MSLQFITGLGLLVILTLAEDVTGQCNPDDCPTLSCTTSEYTEIGECCPKCCAAGVTYRPDTCTTCTCMRSGPPECVTFTCGLPTGCPREIMIEGDCNCFTCPTCVPGNTISPDTCTTCTCMTDLTWECATITCALPTGCPREIMIEGDCGCFTCPRCRKGDTLILDACTTCTCRRKEYSCTTTECDDPACDDGNTIVIWPSVCCPTCHTDCSHVTCLPPPCDKSAQYVPDGECCPVCRVDIVETCPAQTHGGDDCLIWDVDDVVTCGPIDPTDCTNVLCLDPGCPRFMRYTPEGTCCPRCRLFRSCALVRCPPLTCTVPRWIFEHNGCCPRCPSINVERGRPVDGPPDCSAFICLDISHQCPVTDWVYPEGHCCPVCRLTRCKNDICPPLNCPEDQQHQLPGACCKFCVFPPAVRCDLHVCTGTPCPATTWLWDDCCPSCPIMDCSVVLCIALHCHECLRFTPPGHCCAVCRIGDCRNSVCPVLDCDSDDIVWEDGACCPRCKHTDCDLVPCSIPRCDEEDWILKVNPINGERICCPMCPPLSLCHIRACPTLQCPAWLQYLPSGKCCKECLTKLCGTTHCMIPMTPRSSWQWSPGENCPAGGPPGPPDDKAPGCPTPQCPDWLQFLPPGKICKICRIPCFFCWRPDCDFHDWIWEPTACCPRCPDWSCDMIQCRAPVGCFEQQWIQMPGHCCPVCPQYSVPCFNDPDLPCPWPNCAPWEWILPTPWINPFNPECCAKCPPPGFDLPFQCSNAKCPELSCTKALQIHQPGECCPQCDDDCINTICPAVPNCPSWLQFVPEGGCCPKCRVGPCISCPTDVCDFDDWIWEPNACCPRCPELDCDDVMCTSPTCPPDDWIQMSGHCCPVCPDYEDECSGDPALPCSWPGCAPWLWIMNSNDCCPRCPISLDNFAVMCPDSCPDMPCSGDDLIGDADCCPHCKDQDCSGVLCPVPPCDKFLHYTPEGNCCPKCRVGPCYSCPVMTCDFQDWIWEPNACGCPRCPDWPCEQVLCFVPECPSSVWMYLPDHCCPVCPSYGIQCYNSPELLCSWPPCAPWTWEELGPNDCCPKCPLPWLPFSCATVYCPKPNCPVSQQFTPPGECCPRCRTIDCSLVRCARPDCDEPWIKEPSECCPRCPYDDLVDCTKVYCIILSCPPKRWVKNARECCVGCPPIMKKSCAKHCAQPLCPQRDWVRERGACCPRCPVTDCSTVLCKRPDCRKSDWIKLTGCCCPICPDTVLHRPAIDFRHMDCSKVSCKKPECSRDRYVVPSGECCAECADEPVSLVIDDQDDPCACVECAVPKDCEENGGELVVPPGMCCPICMLAIAPACRKPGCHPRAQRKDSLSWCPWCPPCVPGELIDTGEPCMPGLCMFNGKVGIIIIDCLCFMFPDHEYCQCPGLAIPEGECCPQCPEINCLTFFCPALPCPKEVQETLEGECCPRCKTCEPGKRISISKCVECLCNDDGHFDCGPVVCPRLPCDKPVFLNDDSCCPVCLCTPGEPVPSPDPCNLLCICDDGVVRCHQVAVDCFCGWIVQCICPGLHVPEGHCCPVCPEQDCDLLPPCSSLSCPADKQVTEPNACCPRCTGETEII